MQQLTQELLGNLVPIKLNVDNQGAIQLAKNPVHHQRTKHIDIKIHYVRQEIINNNIILNYVPSNDNVADIFTKSANKLKFNKFKNVLMG